MTILRLVPVVLSLALSGGLLAACGGASDDAPGAKDATATPAQSAGVTPIVPDKANAKVTLTIGSKDFTEQKVLGEIYAQGLEAAGYRVRKRLGIGSDEHVALDALESGEIDAYPEYTGTALLSFFDKQPDELPKDPQEAYAEAKKGFAKLGMVAFPPTPFTSANEVAVTKETAARLSLQKISDLQGQDRDLTLAGAPECRERLDCLLGLERIYKLHFKRFTPTPIPDRHEALTSGKADVSIVFTTDPQIQRESEVLLEDDRSMFPPYNSSLVVRKAVADQAGTDLPRTLEMIQARLTDENMQELNARVDLDGQDPADVAKAYLTENGLLATG